MSHNSVHIDIVSDIVCPWCWLGKQYLDAAIRDFHDSAVHIRWRPFQLDAGIPETGMDYKAYMHKKFGSGQSDRFKQARLHLEEAGLKVGIRFRFSELTCRPHTRKAHLLLKWAQEKDKERPGIGHACAESLFRAFFDELKDIGATEILVGIADEVGLDGDLVRELLDTGRDVEAIEQEMAYFRRLGVTSVPTFIYNGTFAISGGQPAKVHGQALKKALATPPKDIMNVPGA